MKGKLVLGQPELKDGPGKGWRAGASQRKHRKSALSLTSAAG